MHDVFHGLFALTFVQGVQCMGLGGPDEHVVAERDIEPVATFSYEFFRLIEAPFAQALGMYRDGDDDGAIL